MRRWLSSNPWVVPLVFALLIGFVGYSANDALERTIKHQLAEDLKTILAADRAAIGLWVDGQRESLEVAAADNELRDAVERLVRIARTAEDPAAALVAAPDGERVRAQMAPLMARPGNVAFGVFDPSGLYIAGTGAVGTRPAGQEARQAQVLRGETIVTPPLSWGATRGGALSILVATPVRDDAGRPIAVLGVTVDAHAEFLPLLELARPAESGETYAFNADGLMLSESRFDDQLRELGLLPDDPEVGSALAIEIRDPGGDMTLGFVPELPVKSRPLTRMAGDAVAGNDGVDVDGYRDYRGVPVIGAWMWLPELEMGITTEVDVAEAFAGLVAVRLRLFAVFGLLIVAGIAMLLYGLVLRRMQSRVDEARQLGRYSVLRKIGSGGMGTVFAARHALLQRPTAIKVLEAEVSGSEAIARFEREVQVASQLSHPNTIEIYDFGRAPDGTFYYAMELVVGYTLDGVVTQGGPLPEARVVHVMSQVCGSIAEAHRAGMIHRDLKPSNVMLCVQGGLYDFVKVLDFGLVRKVEQSRDVALTDVTSLSGTPLYMPPEMIQTPDTVDQRADIYQLGAIAYFLLTGRNVFSGDSPYDVLAKHAAATPTPPSEALGRPVSPDLEQLILRCLSKDPADRYDDGEALLEAFEACGIDEAWAQVHARKWWEGREISSFEDLGVTGTHPSGYSIDMDARLAAARKG